MRTLYFIWVYSIGGKPINKWMVAKTYTKHSAIVNNHWIRQDATWQSYCKILAMKYNTLNPPKSVRFLQPYIMSYRGRAYLVEDMVEGPFQKWTNNTLYQSNRNLTPLAFSHWTLDQSSGYEIVCDIQGWSNRTSYVFTDPQIHSTEGNRMAGDIGESGMKAFIQMHTCNDVCKLLGLRDISSVTFTSHVPKLLTTLTLSYENLFENMFDRP
mmetsp:Transcript_8459/g.35344  ORF Transcript_8459/g.35344 Transcript_8459/m.35344 type:complete len:212 (+) Transcript_8459:149-784(+)|eukprot:CAMPEP_0114608090 /NCGR_PEP_ID=MMETSP0168-20121206/2401_1 /TAXON_ID=95228 ORGANISM="Vannella sp., Strain DIVA3 517/6/12" /NCGR_SAMPLE_ID=MMETSP0168 /ASSEMBLY_ACC=CAM_ASM_000044 /LENGTH=211 /DNA_ID=CAMNT_0001818981 /DNA_START=105 /DNA_END=740 /DNA_ORIENTATION=-